MSTENIIEYFVIPCALILIEAVTTVLLERSRLKKELKSDPNNFTVRVPTVYNITLFAAFVIFTVITVFLNRQLAEEPERLSLGMQIFLDIGLVALAISCLVSAYVFIRIRIVVNGVGARVTPAFSKPYSFTAAEVKEVKRFDDNIKVYVSGRKFSVYRIYHCFNLFDNWLGW